MCKWCDGKDEDEQIVIEFPAAGATYGPAHGEEHLYGVYAYDTYPEGSVLAGQARRRNLGVYPTLEEAQELHPKAEWNGEEGSGFTGQEPPATPPDWLDPANAGESWNGE